MSQLMTGKQALLEMLKAEGVEYIFGNPGTSEGPIIDMLGDYPEFRYILTLQESVAMGMGEAYARATGRASFVSLHVDSGLANGIALMLDALNTGTPMVITSANYDARKINENHDRPGQPGAPGHQVVGGADPGRPDTQRHAPRLQRGQQPPQRAGVRGLLLQRAGRHGRNEHRAVPSGVRHLAAQRGWHRRGGVPAAQRQPAHDAGG